MEDVGLLRVDSERLMADVHSLAVIGSQPSGGITRLSFSEAYGQSAAWLVSRMQAAGMSTKIDTVGNVIGRMGPATGAIIMTGSHIDTVSNGGPLDGAYGVIAGVEVARVLTENQLELTAPFEVVAFIDEEGAFLSLFGSRALTGVVTCEELASASNTEGYALTSAMNTAGLDPAPFLDSVYPSETISKFVELHIEQGPALENKELDIGVVDAVVGLKVIDYQFLGQSNHAGTTPMDMRKDAFRAAAEFVHSAYQLTESGQRDSLRITFGAVMVEPNQANVIPRKAKVRLDCRDVTEAYITNFCTTLANLARRVANRYGLALVIKELSYDPPVRMAGQLVDSITDCVSKLGYSMQVMPSGAGHDAQALAGVCDSGMIFVPSQNGLSHHPDEWTAPDQLTKGGNVLLQTLLGYLV